VKLTEETGEKEEEPESKRRRGEKERERERHEISKIKYQDAVLRGNAVPCYYNRYNRHCPPGDRLLHGQLALHRGQACPDPGSYLISIPRASDLILAFRYHATRKTRKPEVEEHDNALRFTEFTEKNYLEKKMMDAFEVRMYF